MSTEKVFVLPNSPIPAFNKSPGDLLIFSKPKVGKTELVSALPNCLILDLERGSKYVKALKIEAENIGDIRGIGKEIIKNGRPYNYIAVDTITALEDMCIPYAESLYSSTPMGGSWLTKGKLQYGSILNLPNGVGYGYLREAFAKTINFIKTWAPRIILLGHVKDTLLEKNGAEFNVLDLDLTGKSKRITMAKSDAVGYMYRKGNQNILSFKTSDEVICGARSKHLRNKEIVISEIQEDGTIISHWDKIFID